MTAGQELTAALRRYFSIGTRTRRHGKNRYGAKVDRHAEMVEMLMINAQNRGYFTEATTAAFLPGYGAALSWEKHIQGYRADCTLVRQVNDMTPWQFTALLGRMADAGVENPGQGERFFADMARDLHAKSAA